MAHSALIDGTAYGIKGGKCLVDGTEYSIKRGIGLVEGTQVEYKFTVEPSLVINSKSDWDNFVQNSATFSSGDLVRLNTNLDLLGEQYNSIEFSGNFDGGSNTIENATFNQIIKENDEIPYVCGLFATLSNGQIIANLKLKNIACISSETSGICGVLAGCTYGSLEKNVLIQNVHVESGNVFGYRGGGIVGHAKQTNIKYCSAKNTMISVSDLYGGIVCVTDGSVEACFTTDISGESYSTYGITYWLQDGGSCKYCWCYFQVIGYRGSNTYKEIVEEVKESTDYMSMILLGFTQPCWKQSFEIPLEFDENYIKFTF